MRVAKRTIPVRLEKWRAYLARISDSWHEPADRNERRVGAWCACAGRVGRRRPLPLRGVAREGGGRGRMSLPPSGKTIKIYNDKKLKVRNVPSRQEFRNGYAVETGQTDEQCVEMWGFERPEENWKQKIRS